MTSCRRPPTFMPTMASSQPLITRPTPTGNLMGLPRLNHPLFTSRNFTKFSDDGFLLSIERRDEKFDREKTRAFLEEIGATNIELVEENDPA